MNALDRLVAALNPEAGLRRIRARAALQRVDNITAARAYEGAKTGRRTGGWITGSTSADAEVSASASRLRDRARALVRDNPYAARACDTFVANVVGTGITVKAGHAQEVWSRWVNECDADGLLDFYGLQALVMRCMFESGECLIRYRERRPEDGLAVPLQLQVLEPDYLDDRKTGPLKTGGWNAGGVEYDAIGRRVAYHLYTQHPGDSANRGASIESRRIPADQVLHIFERKRPGQTRGVPRMAPILLKMRDLDDYEEAELVRKGIESCFAAIVTTEDTGSGLTEGTTDANGNRIETLGAGLIQYLKPGQDVKFGAPAAGGDYGSYTKTQLRAIASGMGITYEQMTGDLEGVNYSSIRAGLVEFYKTVDMLQWHVLVPMMLQPIWQRWAETAFAVKAIRQRAPELPQWTPPKRQWVDPLKDVNAARNEIGAGITSISETIRARGEDPERVFREISEERALLEKLGIVSDVIATPPKAPAPPNPVDAEEKRATIDLIKAQATRTLAEGRALQAAPAHDQALQAMAEEVRAAVHVLAERKPGDIVINNAPPAVTLHQGEIRNEINVPQTPAPAVEVRNEIHEREQPAPVINVAAPQVDVTVEAIMPEEVKTTIVGMPTRETTSRVERDSNGNITSTTQTETDKE